MFLSAKIVALPIDAHPRDWGENHFQCEIQAAGCVRADPTAEGCQMAARWNTVDARTKLMCKSSARDRWDRKMSVLK